MDDSIQAAFRFTEEELVGAQPARWSGFALGAAGVAYFFVEIHRLLRTPGALERADEWARAADRLHAKDFAEPSGESARFGIFFGLGGLAYVGATIAKERGDERALREAVSRLEGAWQEVAAQEGSIDTYSSAPGFVLAARELRDRGVVSDVVERVGVRAFERTIESLAQPVASRSPGTFVGLAHGLAGAIQASLRWNPNHPSITSALDQLVDTASTGEGLILWPRRLDGPVPDEFADSWCNGIAGHTLLLVEASRAQAEPRHLDAVRAALDTVQLMRASHPTLCCGACGQAVALFRSSDARDRRRAFVRLRTALPEARALTNTLMQGRLGVALVALDLLDRRPPRIPIFDSP